MLLPKVILGVITTGITLLLPEREEPRPVEEGTDGPVDHLPVHGLRGGGQVAVVLNHE